MTEPTDNADMSMCRRTVLRTAAAASVVGFVGVPVFSGSAAAQSSVGQVYLSDSGDDPTSLYTVEFDDNAGEADLTQILGPGDYGSGGDFGQTDAVAATPTGDTVVFYDKSGNLGEYDVATGGFSDVGEVSNDPGGVVLASYSPSGTLWVASEDTNELYTVDRSVPSVTSRGDTGVDLNGADLAFASDGTMYIWVGEPSPDDGLYEVADPSSDTTASEIGDVDTGTDVTGMAILDRGTGNIVVSDNNTNQIIEVDRSDGSTIGKYDMTGDLTNHTFGDMTSGVLCSECPEDFYYKFEWQENDEAKGEFVIYDGDDNRIESVEGLELASVSYDEDGEPTEACFITDYCEVDAVVKAGPEYETHELGPGETCVTGIEARNPGGKSVTYAISNVQFFCEAPDDVSVGNSGGNGKKNSGKNGSGNNNGKKNNRGRGNR